MCFFSEKFVVYNSFLIFLEIHGIVLTMMVFKSIKINSINLALCITNYFEIYAGIETQSDYRFRYGRNPLLELPLAINPSGCARCEGRRRLVLPGKLRSHIPRSFTSSHGSSLLSQLDLSAPPTCPYSKHFVHSKSSQYKKMKQEWRNNVYLAR